MKIKYINTGISKQQLYEKAKYLLQSYNEVNSSEKIIEAVVTAGVYYGLGGRKRLEIGNEYFIAGLVSSVIARAKSMFGNNKNRNIDILNKVFGEQTGDAIRIENAQMDGKNSVALNIIRTDTNYKTTIIIPQNRITDELLVRIANIVMQIYNFSGIETPKDQAVFRNCMLYMLKFI